MTFLNLENAQETLQIIIGVLMHQGKSLDLKIPQLNNGTCAIDSIVVVGCPGLLTAKSLSASYPSHVQVQPAAMLVYSLRPRSRRILPSDVRCLHQPFDGDFQDREARGDGWRDSKGVDRVSSIDGKCTLTRVLPAPSDMFPTLDAWQIPRLRDAAFVLSLLITERGGNVRGAAHDGQLCEAIPAEERFSQEKAYDSLTSMASLGEFRFEATRPNKPLILVCSRVRHFEYRSVWLERAN